MRTFQVGLLLLCYVVLGGDVITSRCFKYQNKGVFFGLLG